MWAGTNAGFVFIYQLHLPTDDRRHADTVDCVLGGCHSLRSVSHDLASASVYPDVAELSGSRLGDLLCFFCICLRSLYFSSVLYVFLSTLILLVGSFAL